MIAQRIGWVIAALLAIPAPMMPAQVQAQTSCVATPLSRSEAEQLLLAIPEALPVEKQGGAVWTVDWYPSSWRTNLFYFLQLLGNGFQADDGGNLGYYAVNKVTGEVFDGLLPDKAITCESLNALQKNMRSKHCVSEEVSEKYKHVSPSTEH